MFQITVKYEHLSREVLTSLLNTYFQVRYTAKDMHPYILFYSIDCSPASSNVVLLDSSANSPHRPSSSHMYPLEYMTDLLLYRISKNNTKKCDVLFKQHSHGLVISFLEEVDKSVSKE